MSGNVQPHSQSGKVQTARLRTRISGKLTSRKAWGQSGEFRRIGVKFMDPEHRLNGGIRCRDPSAAVAEYVRALFFGFRIVCVRFDCYVNFGALFQTHRIAVGIFQGVIDPDLAVEFVTTFDLNLRLFRARFPIAGMIFSTVQGEESRSLSRASCLRRHP
jgi:hypothetical protein